MRRFAVLICLLFVSCAVYAAAGPWASLPSALRFSEPRILAGVQAEAVGVTVGVSGYPLVASCDAVQGTAGSVPPGSRVVVTCRGLEVGRAVADGTGSFWVDGLALPVGGTVEVLWAGADLPLLLPDVNLGMLMPGNERGTVSACPSRGYLGEGPQCMFDGSFSEDCSPYGKGYWTTESTNPGWIARDLGAVYDVEAVWLWNTSYDTDRFDYVLEVSTDGVVYEEVSRGAGLPNRRGYVPLRWALRVPVEQPARFVRLTLDYTASNVLSQGWEMAVLCRFPVSEALSAPEWTVVGGPTLGGPPVVLGRYNDPQLTNGWKDIPYWPDPEAAWIWASPGTAADAPAGRVRFRVPVMVSDSLDAVLHVAVDNQVTVWLDGVPVLYWRTPSRIGGTVLRLSPGQHMLAFEAVNDPSALVNPGGLLVSLTDDTGSVIVRSGSPGWETSGYLP